MTMRLLIGGALVETQSSFDVVNPATEDVIMPCPCASAAQLDEAVAAANAAFPAWAALSQSERTHAIAALADAIEPHAEELARLLTLEQGKPFAEAMGEIGFLIYAFRSLGAWQLPEQTRDDPTRRVEVRRKPLGVVGVIVPWNFPVAMLAAKLPFALLVGNTVVLKPAPTTPLSTVRLGEIIKDILPPGVINIVADDGDLGARMTRHAGIAKISFTGSTATGKRVMEGAAGTLKRITLELGGNDAGIVLDDADPATVAPMVFASAFRNSGQVCVALKRLYVHDSLYDEICERLAALADEAIVGDGFEQGTQFGPVQNKAQYEKVAALIEEARHQGVVIAGAGEKPDKGYFIRPTIVRDIGEGTRLVDEEQFGPVLPVIRYTNPDDAIAQANASPYGLGGCIWSTDAPRAHALAQRMDSGTVWINKHGDLSPDIPFGGAKQSGIGIEFGEEGLAEFTQIQVINAAL